MDRRAPFTLLFRTCSFATFLDSFSPFKLHSSATFLFFILSASEKLYVVWIYKYASFDCVDVYPVCISESQSGAFSDISKTKRTPSLLPNRGDPPVLDTNSPDDLKPDRMEQRLRFGDWN